MPEPPPRKRFQIHLSTAIVLMFVAGALIWANIRGPFGYDPSTDNPRRYMYGWPLSAVASFNNRFWRANPELNLDETYIYQIHYEAIFADLVIAALILIVVWFLCEWLVRRRASKKGPPSRAPDP